MGCCSLKRIVIPSTVKEIKYVGICLYNYTAGMVPNQICDVIFEKNSQLEYVDESGISHGYFRIFFCTPVNVLLHHNAYGRGKASVYSPEDFVFNGTLQSIHINYCYPRMYPEDTIYSILSTKCTKIIDIKMNAVMLIFIVSD